MYKVYRCVDGVHSQNIGGEWATLSEAYEQAQRAAARATSPNIHYRIRGPHPRPMPRPRGEPAPTIWYVLDDENPLPADAMRASEVLAASGPDQLHSPRRPSPGFPLPGGEGDRGRGQPDDANLVIVARKVSRESGRQQHDWEVEDRKTDASLVARSDEELGLGLPVQWGKGKRSRKGEYIP